MCGENLFVELNLLDKTCLSVFFCYRNSFLIHIQVREAALHTTSGSVSSVQLLIRVWLSVTPWTAACQASLSITNSQSLLRLMSIELVMPSHHLILCHPLLPPSVFPSISVLTHESVVCIRWPKYWSFTFNISPSNEYPGLIFLRMDWLDLLAVEGTLKSLLQHHSSKASILQHSAFFMVQLSHLYTLEKPKLWLDGPLLAEQRLCFLICCLDWS